MGEEAVGPGLVGCGRVPAIGHAERLCKTTQHRDLIGSEPVHDRQRIVRRCLHVVLNEASHRRRGWRRAAGAEDLVRHVREQLMRVWVWNTRRLGGQCRTRPNLVLLTVPGVEFIAGEAVEIRARRIKAAEHRVKGPILQHQHDHMIDVGHDFFPRSPAYHSSGHCGPGARPPTFVEPVGTTDRKPRRLFQLSDKAMRRPTSLSRNMPQKAVALCDGDHTFVEPRQGQCCWPYSVSCLRRTRWPASPRAVHMLPGEDGTWETPQHRWGRHDLRWRRQQRCQRHPAGRPWRQDQALRLQHGRDQPQPH